MEATFERATTADTQASRSLEDVLKDVPHSPILIRNILGIYSSGNTNPSVCDGVPQSPGITGDKLQNNCDLNLTDIYPAVKDSVAQAISGKEDEAASFGTAFLVCDDKCYYVTNDHVSNNHDQVGIVDVDGKTVNYGKVVARDPQLDLVLIEPPAGSNVREPVKVGDAPKVGDSLFTVGHPLASPDDVITTGKVSKLGTTLDVKDPANGTVQHYKDLISSGVNVYPGNSGGPQFNDKGQVVGIEVVATRGGSVSIPIQHAMDMIKKAEGK